MKFLKNFLAWIKDLFFGFLTLCIYWLDSSKKNPLSSSKSEKLPIIFIHGYLQRSSALIRWLQRFQTADIGPIFAFNLGLRLSSIEDYADTLAHKIQEASKTTGQKKVRLVGYCMGGLVAAHCALISLKKEGFDPDIEVTDLITFGAPFEGTTTALTTIGKVAKEMAPGSPFLIHLREKMKQATQTRFFLIGSLADQIVKPAHSAVPRFNEKTTISMVEDIGHLEMLFCQNLMNQVINYINSQLTPRQQS